jgi:hypothetical protein
MTPANTFRIWIAGDYSDAVRAVREWCDSRGDCYAVAPCDYVYSGGAESGVCVTRINYGRFPDAPEALLFRVSGLAEHLSTRLFQKSYSIETPSEMLYVKRGGPWDG